MMSIPSRWRNTTILALGCTIVATLSTAPARADIPDENYRPVLEHLLTVVMPPKLAAFRDASANLSEDMDDFCADPDDDGLAEVRDDYDSAMDAWQEIQPWRMGPLVMDGRDQHIEYWPDKHGTATRQLRKLLADRPEIYTNRDRIGETSAALQGFPALEEVLFDAKRSAKLLEDGADGTFLCGYGSAISANLARISDRLVEEWPGFATAMTSAGPDNLDYPDAKFAATDIYRAFHEGLLIIAAQKLGRPMGTGPDDAKASRGESPVARRSLRNIAHNLTGLLAIYDGKWGDVGTEGKGLSALMDSSLLDRSFRLNWQTMTDDLAALPASLDDLLKQPDGYQKLKDFADQVGFVTSLVESDVGGTTQLGGGFNALDGD